MIRYMVQEMTPEEYILAVHGHLSEGAYSFGYLEQIARQTGNLNDRLQAQKYKQRYMDLDKEFYETIVNRKQVSESVFDSKLSDIEGRIDQLDFNSRMFIKRFERHIHDQRVFSFLAGAAIGGYILTR